ncbi:hypothetical protein J3E64_003389 [Sphingobium sp. OAS761]|uniref:hypothetical protein n=1 Tax=Sphingobium sp. OAS761 TaxID=2817901 RepID=UPI00209E0163|nr:hypothetical protein [Sphingobium sp. OAS761]MCP1471676.1 hypothetical protein [Sphingobium sp. OAS761]
MRLRGASILATLAGVPIGIEALEDWICARTPPPRHSEGLDDPLSIAALFHFALSAEESGADPIARATLNMVRTLLDDRAEAALWAPDDLVRFGPVWREAETLLRAPYPSVGLAPLADRVLAVRAALPAMLTARDQLVTTIDGRQLRFEGRSFDLNWIIACHFPAALEANGLALRRLPLMVALPRLLPDNREALEEQLQVMIVDQARSGLSELDRLERLLRALPEDAGLTRRSHVPLFRRLNLVYPGLSRVAVARLLGISHQGATKLMERAASGC